MSQIQFFLLQFLIFFEVWANENIFLCPKKIDDDDMRCKILYGVYNNSKISSQNLSKIKIVNANLDRNGGIDSTILHFNGILDKLSAQNFLFSEADIIIITEIARDCEIYGEYVDGPKELAQRLNLNYAYVVEYVENYKEGDSHQCTIGNAILSRFPFKNLNQIYFKSQCCKHNLRWGGRIALEVDIPINNQTMTIYSTHLESGQNNVFSVIDGSLVRFWQINELLGHINENKTKTDYLIVAGDLNSPLEIFDFVNWPLYWNGFSDAHSSYSFFKRATCPLGSLSSYGLFIFDYIWIKGNNLEYENSLICNENYDEKCMGISDHYPISVDVKIS